MTPIWKKCPAKFTFINLSIHQDRKNNWRVPFKIHFFAHFSLVSLSLHPRSRRGAERIRQGEGRWSRPPKTALERSDLTNKSQFRESHTKAETKKLVTKSLSPQKEKSSSIYRYKGSTWVPANAGTHAPGRAGQHFDLFDSKPLPHTSLRV